MDGTTRERVQNMIQGKHIRLKPVEVSDAEFILSLRTDGDLNKFLSPVAGEIQEQMKWISDYKQRELAQTEFYFKIEDYNSEPLGVVRIYDMREGSFCWGSWIIKRTAPVYAAIESALCVYQFGFYNLGFIQSHFDVRKENVKVNAFHRGFGADLTGEDDLNFYYRLTKHQFEQARIKYRKYALVEG